MTLTGIFFGHISNRDPQHGSGRGACPARWLEQRQLSQMGLVLGLGMRLVLATCDAPCDHLPRDSMGLLLCRTAGRSPARGGPVANHQHLRMILELD